MLRTGARLLKVQILRLELGLVALSAGLFAGLVMSLVLAAGLVAVLAGISLALSEFVGVTGSLLIVGCSVIVLVVVSARIALAAARRRILKLTHVARHRAQAAAALELASEVKQPTAGVVPQETSGVGPPLARFGGVAGVSAAAFSLLTVIGLRRAFGLTRLVATVAGLAATVPEVKAALDSLMASTKTAADPKANGVHRQPTRPPAASTGRASTIA